MGFGGRGFLGVGFRDPRVQGVGIGAQHFRHIGVPAITRSASTIAPDLLKQGSQIKCVSLVRLGTEARRTDRVDQLQMAVDAAHLRDAGIPALRDHTLSNWWLVDGSGGRFHRFNGFDLLARELIPPPSAVGPL
jgi:hypothetical protein